MTNTNGAKQLNAVSSSMDKPTRHGNPGLRKTARSQRGANAATTSAGTEPKGITSSTCV